MILFDEDLRRDASLFGRYRLEGGRMPLPYRAQPYGDGRENILDGGLRVRGEGWLRGHLDRTNEGPNRWRPPTESEVGVVPPPDRPRLFVSHRRADRECAMRVAWLADQAGFDVWIDVLDPDLSDTSGLSDEMAVATVIEMALLNSTHLCAVFTKATAGSQWLPYEYGRVKDGVTMSSRASCTIHPDLASKRIPEWVHLGANNDNEAGLTTWLQREWTDWGSTLAAPTGEWPGQVPEPEELWDACCGADPEACRETAEMAAPIGAGANGE